jgi:hypothetical protein
MSVYVFTNTLPTRIVQRVLMQTVSILYLYTWVHALHLIAPTALQLYVHLTNTVIWVPSVCFVHIYTMTYVSNMIKTLSYNLKEDANLRTYVHRRGSLTCEWFAESRQSWYTYVQVSRLINSSLY